MDPSIFCSRRSFGGKTGTILSEETSPAIIIYAIYPSVMRNNKNIHLLLNHHYEQALKDGITFD
ncbi:hypothetical protein [Legionella gresilensis]|uniref:hypothetical protein n=1 Tax=Legionella gresilensis TaxID=91823 RepID=UPI0010417FBF|nr:hypothetical protein [Legionella gresilensis]